MNRQEGDGMRRLTAIVASYEELPGYRDYVARTRWRLIPTVF